MTVVFDESDKMTSWRGIPQSVYISEFDDFNAEHGLGGFRWEAIGGVVGIFASGYHGIGAEHKSHMKAFPNSHFAQMLIPDQPSGEIDWDWKEDGTVIPKINYVMKDEWIARFKTCMKTMAKFYFEGGAKKLVMSHNTFAPLTSVDEISRFDDYPIAPGLTKFFSAHPQGSCRMGLTAENSVVNQDLKVHTLNNIYIMDGSVMPTSASTHTMLPIMTMADFAVHKIIKADNEAS
jgi:choline dehydrogenase-like flavoprotein